MDEKYKNIMMALAWVFSIATVVIGMNYLYTEFGTNTPYHNIYPDDISKDGEDVEQLAHMVMYILDLGIPVFVVLIGHHLLMNFRDLVTRGH